MRICMVTGIFPPDIGGPATFVYNLSYDLNRLGHNILIVTFGDDNTSHPFKVLKISRKYPILIRLFLMFKNIVINRNNFDILYTHGGPWDSGIVSILAKYILKKPVVTKVTGDNSWERARNKEYTDDNLDIFQSKRYGLNIEVFRFIQKTVVQRADLIIVPSEYLKNIVMGWEIKDNKIRVIYNAPKYLKIPCSANEMRDKLGIKGKVISTVCRLVPFKGIDKIIEVMAELDEDIYLVIVGDGPYKERLKELSESLKLDNRIIFMGSLSHEIVLYILKESDVFILNSEHESFSFTILEALNMGTPVITTDVGGNREVIEDGVNGILIRPGDIDGLKSAINKLLYDKEFRNRIIENGMLSLNRFKWDNLIENTLLTLNSAIK